MALVPAHGLRYPYGAEAVRGSLGTPGTSASHESVPARPSDRTHCRRIRRSRVCELCACNGPCISTGGAMMTAPALSVLIPRHIGEMLNAICKYLQITRAQFEKAVTSYRAVGEWLQAPGSELHVYRPEIYPQGSMALLTTVRPWTNEEFDVDLVLSDVVLSRHFGAASRGCRTTLGGARDLPSAARPQEPLLASRFRG